MDVGFIGLGHMGAGMASNLLKASHNLTVYNRTEAKARPLAAKGAKIATTIADACKGDAVFTMLANDEAVEEVVYGEGGVLAGLAKGAAHVSSSTISVMLSSRMTADHAKAEQHYIAAPVLGRPDLAAAGKLFVVVGGAPDAIRTINPLLDKIGQKTIVVSEVPSVANLVKLSANFLIASVIESIGEAMALVGKAGLDRTRYFEFLTSTLFDAPAYRTYGGLVAREAFEPAGFAAPLGEKDIRLALAAAEDLRVPMPFASILHDRFLTLLANDGERLDWSAIGGLAARDAGIAKEEGTIR